MTQAKKFVTDILKSAGISTNGKKPWDIHIHDEQVYELILRGGDIAAGEAYVEGKWDCDQIDEFINKLFSEDLDKRIIKNFLLSPSILLYVIKEKFTPINVYQDVERHYDIGNDLFSLMLDKRMVYTCAYWKNATTLDQAQENKLDLICKKLSLKKGMRVLDIGGGWGSFAKFAAEKYDVSVVNITISKAQIELANKLCKGLPVENRFQHYQETHDKPYDRIVSIGMFEQVRAEHFDEFMTMASRNLKDDGLFLLHTIGTHQDGKLDGTWIGKYIFPRAQLPRFRDIAKALDKKFVVEDLHNFGPDYDKTLMAWYKNFDKNWPQLRAKYGDHFYRMWKLYLLSCAGSFRSRRNQLWQFVLSKKGVRGGYESIR